MYQAQHMRPRCRGRLTQHLAVTAGLLLVGIGLGGIVAIQSLPR